MIARRCSAKKVSLKISQNSQRNVLQPLSNTVLQSLSNTVKGHQAVRLATLLKRDPHTDVSEPSVCRSSTKSVFLNNSQENTYVEVSTEIKFRSRRITDVLQNNCS